MPRRRRRSSFCPAAPDAAVAPNVAPGGPDLGVMLPATPLHHLLLRELGFPLVATSGNLSEEPICTDEREAVDAPRRASPTSSSSTTVRSRATWTTASRASSPGRRAFSGARADGRRCPVRVRAEPARHSRRRRAPEDRHRALGRERGLPLPAHRRPGDARGPRGLRRASSPTSCGSTTRRPLPSRTTSIPATRPPCLRGSSPTSAAFRLIAVQHHHAHLASCLAENEIDGPALGVTWDGTGYGTDGTIWGGEFLLGDAAGVERVAHLRSFRLPGGEAAVREPRRTALALLAEVSARTPSRATISIPCAPSSVPEREVLARMLARGVNTPVTTSAGRLFDAVASLLGLVQRSAFEGQAAMAVEAAALAAGRPDRRLSRSRSSLRRGRPGAPRLAAASPRRSSRTRGAALRRASSPHASTTALADGIAAAAVLAGAHRVALTGGCFQNRLLTERRGRPAAVRGLRGPPARLGPAERRGHRASARSPSPRHG